MRDPTASFRSALPIGSSVPLKLVPFIPFLVYRCPQCPAAAGRGGCERELGGCELGAPREAREAGVPGLRAGAPPRGSQFSLDSAFASTLLCDLANVSSPLWASATPSLATAQGLKHQMSLMPFDNEKSGRKSMGEIKPGKGASEWVPVNARPMMVTQQTVRNLALGDKFFVRVAAVNSAGSGPPAVLDQPVHIQETIEAPKIRVPRHLRQTYIRQVGETINLQIPFQGNPKPQASWTHNGHALDSQRVNVRTGDQDSILFIRSAQRSDSGCYELTAQLEGLEAKAAINVLVIEKPGCPGTIRLLDVWGCNAALEWTPPQDTGGTELLGYTVQKADKKTGQWFTVLERYHPTTCTVSDLIVGNSYSFRVFSENLCGLSESAAVTKELAHIQKTDTVAKPKSFVERDFSEAPSFTQPLADHTSTPGYSTQLFCSVRASPKPKIIWMKNKMDIQGDPRYRALSEQGVCTLEIRKPSPFDSGVYTCKAVNALGEAAVDCRLEVKASATH
ncbi:myosin-binding protein H isoform X1 [Camelus dromedarius]|uniref:myosin-binding protein H isoform X1 n=1 Tax=Camelus dromedarius TaxID=9838 RepID=UPI00311995D5